MSRSFPQFPFLTSTGVVLLVLGGCAPTWAPVALPTPADTAWHVADGKVRVARSGGDTLVGDGASLRGDSVWVAQLQGSYVGLRRGEIVSIDHQVQHTRLIVAAVIGSLLVVGLALAFKSSLDAWHPCLDIGGQCAQ